MTLSKQEKGRLKKLHSKSSSITYRNVDVSGIRSNEEANEYQSLIKKKLEQIKCDNDDVNNTNPSNRNDKNGKSLASAFAPNGPCIQIRTTTKNQSSASIDQGDDEDDTNNQMDQFIPRMTEGDDHRNILHGLLFQSVSSEGGDNTNSSSNNKKRKRQNKNKLHQYSIPSWATIHNPALVQNIAVLELNIMNVNKSSAVSSLQNNISTRMPILNSQILSPTYEDRHVLFTKMRLSQDNHGDKKKKHNALRPRNLTDVMMYSEKKYQQQQQEEECDDDKDEDSEDDGSIKKQKKNDANLCNNESEAASNPKNIDDITKMYSQLETMKLNRKELIKQGYPIFCNAPSHDNEPITNYDEHKDGSFVKEKLTQIAKKINSKNGDEYNSNNSKELDDILSSALIKDQANTIIQKLHAYSTLNKVLENTFNENDSIDTRIYVPTCLERKDVWNRTSSLTSSSTLSPTIYALDCEMVGTSIGSEVARISLIRLNPIQNNLERFTVVLDTCVKPNNPVLDYKTQYSGITPNSLKGVTVTLVDVQTLLLSLICLDDILIGHSLENDLRVLRLVHENVIDTAMLFRNISNGRKHSLKHLSLCLLKQNIQQTGSSSQTKQGHDSVEDASATLLLAIRRSRLGPEKFRIYDKKDYKINLMETLTNIRKNQIQNQPLFFQRQQIHSPIVCLGPNEWIKDHVGGHKQSAVHILQCENLKSSSIKAISSYLRPGSSRSSSMLWAKICIDTHLDEDFESNIDSMLNQVINSASSNAIFLVLVQAYFDEAKSLYKQQMVAKDPRATLRWSDANQLQYNQAMKLSNVCDCFWIGKN